MDSSAPLPDQERRPFDPSACYVCKRRKVEPQPSQNDLQSSNAADDGHSHHSQSSNAADDLPFFDLGSLMLTGPLPPALAGCRPASPPVSRVPSLLELPPSIFEGNDNDNDNGNAEDSLTMTNAPSACRPRPGIFSDIGGVENFMREMRCER